ncbi:immunoglobulin superfamily member 10-like isoform X1 [Mytilus edulis]|uniref:immunoglobulin superfamily member 10-like isoform X1 n=1 Tax=Mytilus edulis TaxID=6550 RepID=UPI0039F11BC0
MTVQAKTLLHLVLLSYACYNVVGLTCGNCQDVLKPEQCTTKTQCGADQLCGINQFMSNFALELRYHLRCMTKSLCSNLQSLPGDNLCVQCCNTSMCNTHVCREATTIPTTSITKVPTPPTMKHSTKVPILSTKMQTTPTTKLATKVPATTTTPPSPLVLISKSIIVLHSGHGRDQFTCIAENVDHLNIYVDGMKIKTISKITVSNIRYEGIVTIWRNATYKCEGVNIGTNQRASASVSIFVKGTVPYFPVKDTNDVYVQGGETVGLTCIPEGDPKPTITWTLPNMDSNTRQSFIDFYYERVEIRLKNMTPILAGTYTCAAHNPLGTATFTYHVFYKNTSIIPILTTQSTASLLIKPDIFLQQSINVTEGRTTLAIPCSADGIPVPKIHWSVDQGSMPTNIQQYQNYLIIHNVGLQDSGFYKCTATNKAGTTMKGIRIIVNPKPHIPPTVSLITNLQVQYGSTVHLHCNATGYPEPEILWFVNGVQGGKSKDFIIPMAKLIDTGAYVCVAVNDAGRDQKTSILLVSGTHPSIVTSTPTTVQTTSTKPVSLTCNATGNPPPTITWRFQAFVGPSHIQQTLSLDNSTLTLSHADRSGRAMCTASNPLGQVQASFSIILVSQSTILGR